MSTIHLGLNPSKELEELAINQIAYSRLKHMPNYQYDCLSHDIYRELGIRRI